MTDWKNIDAMLEELPLEESEQRRAVVREAQSWLGTPYHENGDIKGAGVDCGMILIRVYSAVGVIESFDPRPYPVQWAFNQRAERYLDLLNKFSIEVSRSPLPADVVVFKVGHCWAHGAIVTDWPGVIHANPPGRCREENVKLNFSLSGRVFRVFSAWEQRN